MIVFIRTDSSYAIGTGHVMRCLTLADRIRQQGHEVQFLCRMLPGNMNSFIAERYPVHPILKETDPQEFFWEQDAAATSEYLKSCDGGRLIVDHYGIDFKWEAKVRPYVSDIMVIDDLANRHHDCDILLDQNFVAGFQNRYRGLIPAHCQMYAGPKFSLLRPEFYQAKQYLKSRDGTISRIIVSFGGSDPTGEIAKVLAALRQLSLKNVWADVIAGAANPRYPDIQRACGSLENVRCHKYVSNMAELMAQADLAIGAGGATTWERCYLALPAIAVITADNQRDSTESVAQMGALKCLGWHEAVSSTVIAEALAAFLSDPESLRVMSQKASALMQMGSSVNATEEMEQLLTGK